MMNKFVSTFYVTTLLSCLLTIGLARLVLKKRKLFLCACGCFFIITLSYQFLETAGIITNVSYECWNGAVRRTYVNSNFYSFMKFANNICNCLIFFLIADYYIQLEKLKKSKDNRVKKSETDEMISCDT